MGKKVNYLMFDGKKYEAVEQEKYISGSCDGCCFLTLEGGCTMPATDGFFISCNDGFIFAEEGEVAAQQRLTERSEKELGLDNPIGFSNAKLNTLAPPPEKHPSGEKDICRYLSFNLGNVVKHVCQASRKGAGKKVEGLREAMSYLEDEINRLEESND